MQIIQRRIVDGTRCTSTDDVVDGDRGLLADERDVGLV